MLPPQSKLAIHAGPRYLSQANQEVPEAGQGPQPGLLQNIPTIRDRQKTVAQPL